MTRDFAIQTLQHWLRDPDLAGLRDKDALEKLPEKERDRCAHPVGRGEALLDQVAGS